MFGADLRVSGTPVPEFIAVFEASNRRMLPKKYATLGIEALQARLNELKLKVAHRRSSLNQDFAGA